MKLNSNFSQLHLFLGVLFFSVFFLSNCEEEPLQAGLDLLPEDDLLSVIDTILPVELYTISDEALYTRSVGASPLGSVNDPEIGIIEADFITDFIYSNTVSFINDPVDSVFFVDLKVEIAYDALTEYGNLDDFGFNVYELLEPLPDYTKSDYKLFPHMYDAEPLNIGAPVKLNADTAVYVAELSQDFATRLLDTALINEGIYNSTNQRLFKEYFKGFYITADAHTEDGGGFIIVDHSNSKMILRTVEWNDDSLSWDTLSNVFSLGNPESTIDTGGVHLNMYRNTLTPNLEGIIDNFDSLHNKAYINSLSGPMVLVKLPALSEIRSEFEGQISVNFAKLVIPFDSEIFLRDSALYTPPNKLGLFDSELKSPILDDQLAENHLDGNIDMDNFEYQFNIGNHVHDYLRSEGSIHTNSFHLFPATGSPVSRFKYTPARIVLLQDSALNKNPYVRIVYSIIPK